LGDLGATYDVHLRLIGKRVVDVPLVLTELFLLGATAEARQVNINWLYHALHYMQSQGKN